MRKEIIPEQVFYNEIRTLIYNLLINNVNYRGTYYFNDSSWDNTRKVIDDTQDRARFILEKMEEIKHLINLE